MNLTSNEISELLNKRHSAVLRDIRHNIKNGILSGSDFKVSSYTNSQNKRYPSFLITENGFDRLKSIYESRTKNRISDILYIIKHIGFDHHYKIGITCDLEGRVKSFNNVSPLGVKVVYSFKINNAREIESLIHDSFRDCNTNLEWFNLSDADLKTIKELVEDQKRWTD